MGCVVSVDIGSTYTKGAVLSWEENALAGQDAGPFKLLARVVVPTSVEHLPDGFYAVMRALAQKCPQSQDAPVYFSSSAKGGLNITAIGIVPELTLKSAKLTALSAGGRVENVVSYKMTRHQLEELEASAPDIVLLAGGTDGGNETYVLHNARMLARSRVLQARAAVVYAGNEAVADEVEDILCGAGYDVRLAPNIMPEIEVIRPEGAREELRRVFLERIVKGRGLDELVRLVGRQPNPTPYAMLNLVEAIAEHRPDWGDFVVVDMGGATTDIYSGCSDSHVSERVVYRGIVEPHVKRTVEGDLGMRVSALSAAQCVPDPEQSDPDFKAFVAKVNAHTEYLPAPDNTKEIAYDVALARACAVTAIERHAGTYQRVFTAMGEAFVQRGKDLRRVRHLVGSGGYLSRQSAFSLGGSDFVYSEEQEIIPLVPREPQYSRDSAYIWPLLGNLVQDYPEQAVRTALDSLDCPQAEGVCLAL